MNPDSAREAILKASGRLRGPLGRPWFSRTLVVFRRSWFHYQPWVVANISVQGSATGSSVSIRVARTWFMAGFMTLFAVFALGGPIVFFAATLVSNQLQGGPAWWTYPLWIAQDAGIYGAVMAANTFFARRDRDWLVARIGSLVAGTASASRDRRQ
jgi:hypothetical protein